jgi:hypothetical protein
MVSVFKIQNGLHLLKITHIQFNQKIMAGKNWD